MQNFIFYNQIPEEYKCQDCQEPILNPLECSFCLKKYCKDCTYQNHICTQQATKTEKIQKCFLSCSMKYLDRLKLIKSKCYNCSEIISLSSYKQHLQQCFNIKQASPDLSTVSERSIQIESEDFESESDFLLFSKNNIF
ncbi:hypothetical protein TTHERM_00401929 (macronuclear) [Tetrahymena thermophila SB210]|uniref:Uncharacterized protein n=1 Tax=Tetrahymena thermophila (strain SB210) TaxID=312017 RepID=A4VE43_TETTS|nr:hypothetical protein TTHERM_00401929 [Tetrahymena thermophila SB210]EDK31798.1 hypothetical protein TTHERM_00401929 [Tetrahymena thermophila SB210]|eukprot:XP_001470759.1 hypothetical protein TTHERM_00401929 [Tetrahymena thermophila SB210]